MSEALRKFRIVHFDVILLAIAYFINPMGIDYLIGYLLVPLVLLKRNFLVRELDRNTALLCFFSFSYAIFYYFNPVSGLQFVAIYALFPPIFYLLGKYVVDLFPKPQQVFYLLFLTGVIMSITPMISVTVKLLEGGLGILDRNLPNIWTGEIVPATIMGSFFTLNMCIPAILTQNKVRTGLWFRIAAIAIFVISLLCILRIGSRTQLLICFLTFSLSLVYVVPKQSFSKNVFLFFLLIGLGVYLTRNVSFSWDADWLAAFTDRMDGSGGDVMSGGGRTDRWSKSFKYLLKKPLGWEVEEFGYAHNLWLDVLRVAGFIPFLTLLVFTIKSFLKAIQVSKKFDEHLAYQIQLRVYALALFLIFMVEPIFEGMYPVFLFFCLFVGTYNKLAAGRSE